MSIRPSVISLFSGAGGSALGYRLGGFNELLGIDIDQTACNTFQHNFSLTPAWNRDISSVEVSEILQYIDIDVGQLDVLDIHHLVSDSLSVAVGIYEIKGTIYFWKQPDSLKVLDQKYF